MSPRERRSKVLSSAEMAVEQAKKNLQEAKRNLELAKRNIPLKSAEKVEAGPPSPLVLQKGDEKPAVEKTQESTISRETTRESTQESPREYTREDTRETSRENTSSDEGDEHKESTREATTSLERETTTNILMEYQVVETAEASLTQLRLLQQVHAFSDSRENAEALRPWTAADLATAAELAVQAADIAKAANAATVASSSSSFREGTGNAADQNGPCPCSCRQCQCFGYHEELLPASGAPGPLNARLGAPGRLVKNCCC